MTKQPLPEPEIPWVIRAGWRLREWVTWPFTVRKLKQAGFRRTGWRTWESGPYDG